MSMIDSIILLQKAKPLHPRNKATIANNIKVTLRSLVELVNFGLNISEVGLKMLKCDSISILFLISDTLKI